MKSGGGCRARLAGGLCPVFIPVLVKDSVDVGFPSEIRDRVPLCLFNPLGLGLIAELGEDFLKGNQRNLAALFSDGLSSGGGRTS